MANVMFKKGLLASLPSTYAEGTFYVTTDERAIYLDVNDTTRIRLGDFQEFATLAELQANPNPSTTALYFVTELNCLVKYNGTAYIQINRDTGMTSVEVVGEGNAVTAAVYDAEGRKLTLTKGATYATPAEVDAKIKATVGEIPADSEGAAQTVRQYIDAKTEGIASDEALSQLTERVGTAEDEIDALQEKVGEKAVGTQITEAIDALKLGETYEAKGAAKAVQGETTSTVKDVEDSLNTYKTNNDTAVAAAKKAGDDAAAALEFYKTTNDEAVAAAKKSGDDAMAEAQKKVASVAAGDASVTVAGTATAPTVAAKLSQDADNALVLAEDGLKVVIPAAAEYTIEKAAESGEYAAVYALKKDGVQVGASINIPKDMVVESGSVVENPEGQAEGTYIKLVLQNVDEPLYINVGSLIEYVTSGSAAGDMVVIAVSDDHKVTATITDGSITLAKLHTDIQTAIGKAHSHENAAVLAGITEQNIVDWNDAVAKEHEHANKDVIDGITAEKVAAWDGAQAAAEATAAAALSGAKTELEGKIADAQAAAEKVANDHNTAMDTRMQAVEGKAHEHANKAELDKIADGDKAKWDAASAKAHEHANATTLAGVTDEKVAAWDAAESNAKAYTDAALTWGSF